VVGCVNMLYPTLLTCLQAAPEGKKWRRVPNSWREAVPGACSCHEKCAVAEHRASGGPDHQSQRVSRPELTAGTNSRSQLEVVGEVRRCCAVQTPVDQHISCKSVIFVSVTGAGDYSAVQLNGSSKTALHPFHNAKLMTTFCSVQKLTVCKLSTCDNENYAPVSVDLFKAIRWQSCETYGCKSPWTASAIRLQHNTEYTQMQWWCLLSKWQRHLSKTLCGEKIWVIDYCCL